MDQNDFIGRVVHCVKNLFRRKTNIDRMEDCTQHWHCKQTFQITVTVPVEHGHGVADTNSKGVQRIGGSRDPFTKRLIGQTTMARVDNLLIPVLLLPMMRRYLYGIC